MHVDVGTFILALGIIFAVQFVTLLVLWYQDAMLARLEREQLKLRDNQDVIATAINMLDASLKETDKFARNHWHNGPASYRIEGDEWKDGIRPDGTETEED